MAVFCQRDIILIGNQIRIVRVLPGYRPGFVRYLTVFISLQKVSLSIVAACLIYYMKIFLINSAYLNNFSLDHENNHCNLSKLVACAAFLL